MVDIEGFSLRDLAPLADQHCGCIVVNLDIGTENVKVEGRGEKTSCTSPPLPIGNE